jgi:hypothetical protein
VASSHAAGEPLAGTAPRERAYVCVEQPPPWGHDAVRESIPRKIADELLDRARAAAVRVLVVRSAVRGEAPRGRVFLAWTGAEPFLVEQQLGSPEELLELDLPSLGAGIRPVGAQEREEPMFLVCTNGRRDACCARYGRAAAAALAERLPSETWESSHLGAHRFAATMLALPAGFCFGRLDAETVVDVALALRRGDLRNEFVRGRVGIHPALQVAETAVRAELDASGVGDVVPTALEDECIAWLDVPGGRITVRVAERNFGLRRSSCGDDAKAAVGWAVAGRPERVPATAETL